MSVSSHLTPEPERRLWVILEHMQHSVEWTDHKIGAITAFAVIELALVKMLAPAGLLGFLTLLLLALALPIGVFAFSPLTGLPKWLYTPELHKDSASIDH